MHHRSKLVLAVGALLLATPVLSSCGFNLATDRVNTTTNGATNRDEDVDVLSATIVAAQPGSGTLSARLVNNTTESVALESVANSGDTMVTVGAIEPTEIVGQGAVNVSDLGGIRVDGDFEAGDFVPLVLAFTNGVQVTLDVPVVKACDYHEGGDSAAPIDAAAESEPESADAYSCEPAEEEGH